MRVVYLTREHYKSRWVHAPRNSPQDDGVRRVLDELVMIEVREVYPDWGRLTRARP